MMLRRALVVLSLLLATLPLDAALVASALTGRVTTNDAPLGAVAVSVRSTARESESPRVTVTDPYGNWWLAPLPPGDYDITFSQAGFATLIRNVRVELGRVTRVDARLEPSEDDETVTSTTRDITVTGTTAITTHFSRLELDRLPLRGRLAAASLAPSPMSAFLIVDTARVGQIFIGDEAVDELTVFRGGLAADFATVPGAPVAVRTRVGGDELRLSLRNTWSSGATDGHLLESASGGRLLAQRLWFFAAGWSGHAPYQQQRDVHGVQLSADAQLGLRHHLEARWLDSEGASFDTSAASVRYTAMIGARWTADAALGHVASLDNFNTLAAKLSCVTGSHVLAAGVDRWSSNNSGFFVNDRFAAGRWTLNAGLRAEHNDGALRLAPRAAATYDIRRDGRHALSASFGRYALPLTSASDYATLTLGYAAALGTSGLARVDLLRHDGNALSGTSMQAEARYRLFDRVESGATYGYHDLAGMNVTNERHNGALWGGVQLPLGDHEVGFTLLERYRGGWSTDLAVRYVVPFERFAVTIAGDLINAFDVDAFDARTVRLWARVVR